MYKTKLKQRLAALALGAGMAVALLPVGVFAQPAEPAAPPQAAVQDSLQLLSAVPTNIDGDGNSGRPYILRSADDLRWFAAEVNGGNNEIWADLHSDIDLGGKSDSADTWWTPIGNDTYPFRGSFRGNGNTIQGLYIKRVNESIPTGAGLFGVVEGRVEDLTVQGSIIDIQGLGLTGALVGRLENGGVVEDCRSLGNDIKSDTAYVGGLVGICDGKSKIVNCHNQNTSVSGQYLVGGVVGESDGSLVGCSNSGAISGHERVGGVCGGGKPVNCFNSGKITGVYLSEITGESVDNSAPNIIGGVAGWGEVTNCLNVGAVTAASGG